MTTKPVFLFAFANDAAGRLRLDDEWRKAEEALEAHNDTGRLTFNLTPAATLDDIFKKFNRFHRQIAVFHYGGHSGSQALDLTDTRLKDTSLATLIGQEPNLQLVFLNGCSNVDQVQVLFAQGVPAVIATSAPVDDRRAVQLSQQFYRALTSGRSIGDAFTVAAEYVNNGKAEVLVALRGPKLEQDTNEFPWGLYVQDERVLIWTIPQKQPSTSATIDAEGNVIVGDGNKIFNLKEAAQSQTLIQEMEDLDRQLAETRQRIEEYPDVPVFKQDLLRISEKRNLKQNELDLLKAEILKLAEDFSRIPINTERLRLARQHFERGEFKEARAILDAEAMGQELKALLREKDRLKSKVGTNEQQLKDKANEFLILARLTAVDFELPDRFNKTIHYFEQSLQAWRTEENIFAFAYFLQEHNQLLQSLPLYEESLDIRKRLSQSNPERYDPDVAMTQNNLGNMYFSLGKMEKAMTYLDQSLPIYQKMAKKSPQAFDLQVARTLLIKALILVGQGNQAAANETLTEAKSIAEKYPDAPLSETVLQYYKQHYR